MKLDIPSVIVGMVTAYFGAGLILNYSVTLFVLGWLLLFAIFIAMLCHRYFRPAKMENRQNDGDWQ